jgi:hypothetical protein
VAALFTLNEAIAVLDRAVLKLHRADQASQRLATVPGIARASGVCCATVVPLHDLIDDLFMITSLSMRYGLREWNRH